MASHDDIDKHVKVYILIFVSLMVLTLVTVAISYLDLSVPMAVALALLVATVKGSLVACYFMHLLSEKRMILAILAMTMFFFFAILFLPVMTQSDALGTDVGAADVAAQHETHDAHEAPAEGH